MTTYKYYYTTGQFPNNKYDSSKLDREIRESDIVISLSHLEGSDEGVDILFRNPLDSKQWTTLSGVVAAHDGIEDGIDDIQYVKIRQNLHETADHDHIQMDIADELRDRSGKLRIHQTSRKIGTIILWTGQGDDASDPSSIGGGEYFAFNYTKGNSDPLIKYVDFNMVENETWLHEGYLTWKDCYLDTLDLMLVTRATGITVSSGTNYNLYGGYLVTPAYPGTGTIDITTDITEHDGGLVYMPDNDQGEYPLAFWNAEWDSSTQKYVNITAAPAGDGRYNMFAGEVPLAHFVRSIPLLDSGFIALNSSDTDQLGHGMRLKMIADTNTTMSGVGDHDWSVACILCMHRERTV